MMNFLRQNKVRVGWVIVILTVILDIPAYFIMPEMMVVQVGLTGDATSMVEKDVYLFLVTLLVAFFAYLNASKKNETKMYWVFLTILLFLCHFFMMATNLMM